MENKNMTALMSCFVRCYHSNTEKIKVFDDFYAKNLLTKTEYNMISENLKKGISFFNNQFNGTEEQALKWIINNNLGPTVLGRSKYTESMLENSIKQGVKQYLLFASGYDTYFYRKTEENIKVFEIDKEELIIDKEKRLNKEEKPEFIKCDFTSSNWEQIILNNKEYDKDKLSFSSILGLSYYLTKEEFNEMLNKISKIIKEYSTIIFDYKVDEVDENFNKQEQLTKTVNEEMKAKYTYDEIEKVLEENGFLIYEHLTKKEIEEQYFKEYNNINFDCKMAIPNNVNYCMAVKHKK